MAAGVGVAAAGDAVTVALGWVAPGDAGVAVGVGEAVGVFAGARGVAVAVGLAMAGAGVGLAASVEVAGIGVAEGVGEAASDWVETGGVEVRAVGPGRLVRAALQPTRRIPAARIGQNRVKMIRCITFLILHHFLQPD